jgi:hypothetical protein
VILERNFSVENWKRQEESKKKSNKRKKRDGIQTTELNRRDQVTAPNSWAQLPSKDGEPRSIIR